MNVPDHPKSDTDAETRKRARLRCPEDIALRLETLYSAAHGRVAEGVGKAELDLGGLDAACRDLLRQSALPPLDRDPSVAPGPENLYIVTEIYPAGGHRLLLEQMIRSRPGDRHAVLFTDLLHRTRSFGMARMADLGVSAEAPDPQFILWDKWMWLRHRLASHAPQRVFLLHHPEDVLAALLAQEIEPIYGHRLIHVRHSDTVGSLGADLAGATHLAIRPAQQAALLARTPDLAVSLLPLCHDPDSPPLRVVAETPLAFARASDALSRRLRLRRGARAVARRGVWAGRRLRFSLLRRMAEGRGTTAPVTGPLVTATCGTEHKFALSGPLALPAVLARVLAATGGRHVHIGPASPAFRRACVSALAAAGIGRSRLRFTGEVPSVTVALQWHRVGLYLGSFPVGGALSQAEAGYAGVPIAVAKPAGTPRDAYMAAEDFAPDQVLRWTCPEDLARTLATDFGPVRRALLGRSARAWYEASLSPTRFADALDRLCQELQDVPLPRLIPAPQAPEPFTDRAETDQPVVIETRDLRSGPGAAQQRVAVHPAASVFVARPRVVSHQHIAQESQTWQAPEVEALCWSDAIAVGGGDGLIAATGAWIDPGLDGLDPRHMQLRDPGPILSLQGGEVRLQRRAEAGCLPAAIAACGCYSHNYFHFLLEVLPRARAAARIAPPGTPVLTENDLPVQCYQALRLSLPDHPVQTIARGQSIAADRLYSAGMGTIVNDVVADGGAAEGSALRYHPDLVQQLVALRGLAGDGPAPEKLLLWRRSKGRRLLGGHRLRAALEARGFVTVETSELSFPDQVRLMANARVIVAQSGAQVTNMAFAPRGCRVLVLLSDAPGINYRLWSAMGGILGHEVINVAGPHRAGPSGIHADFTIPEDLLLPLIDAEWPRPIPAGVSACLTGLYALTHDADVLTGSWAVLSEVTPPGFAARLAGLRRGAVAGVAAAPGSGLEGLLEHAFFADYGRNLRSGFLAFDGFDAAERAAADRALEALRALAAGEAGEAGPTDDAATQGGGQDAGATLDGVQHVAGTQGGIGDPLRTQGDAPAAVAARDTARASLARQDDADPLVPQDAADSDSPAEAARRRLMLGMLLVENWRVPLPADPAALPGDVLERWLHWATLPPFLSRPGEDAAWVAHVARLLDWIADGLDATRGARSGAPAALRKRLLRLVSGLDLGQLLLVDAPLGAVQAARNRVLEHVALRSGTPRPRMRPALPGPADEATQDHAAAVTGTARDARAGLAETPGQTTAVAEDAPLAAQARPGAASGAAPEARTPRAEMPTDTAPAAEGAPLAAQTVPGAASDAGAGAGGPGSVSNPGVLPEGARPGASSHPAAAASGDAAGPGRARPDGPLPAALPAGRRRIGILCRTFEKGPDSEAVVAFCQGLDPARHEVFAYSVGFRDRVVSRDPAFDARFDATIAHRRELPGDPSGIRAQILADELDVFVYANATTYGIQAMDVALYHRVAPLQVVLNSHLPMAMGYPSFDAVITGQSDDPAQEVDQAQHSERLLRVPGPVIAYLTTLQPRAEPALDRAALGLAEDDVVMMNAGSSMKLRHDSLAAMMRAVADVPRGVLLLAPYNPGWAARSLAFGFNVQVARTAAEVGLDPGRIRILGELSVAEAEAALSCADVYLNPFPHGGATMTHLALIYGVPPVTLRRGSTRSIDQFLVASLGFPELLASTIEDYVALARALGRDPARRRAIATRLRTAARNPVFVDSPDHARRMRDALDTLMHEKERAEAG